MTEEENHEEAPLHPTAQELEQQLEAEKKRSADCVARLKYLQADFENLRKRCDREVQQASQYSNERIVVSLLDVVDELELAVKNAKATNSAQTLVEGVEMTLKRLRKVLEQEGVTPIESVNAPFDPSKHNALAREERDDIEDCVVTQEIRKGYMMKGKVIRPSMVKVAVKKASQSQNIEEKANESS